jgi:CRP/FNR family cyclic AMP-dependent transcriptional regulator
MAEENRAQRVARSLPAGSVVYQDGEEANTMFVLQSGRVRLVREHDDGEQIVGEIGPGEFFGEMSILVGKPRTATAVVVEDAKLLELDARTFSDLVKNHSEVAVRLLRRLAQRLDQANGLIEVLVHREPVDRVVAGLMRFAEFDGREASGGAMLLPLDLGTLAGRIGLSRQEVLPVLRRLRRLSLVESVAEGFLIPDVLRLGEFHDYLSTRVPRAA